MQLSKLTPATSWYFKLALWPCACNKVALDGSEVGAIEDYAHSFKNSPRITEGIARARGLLSRAKGQAGFDLGKNAADDFYSRQRMEKKPSRRQTEKIVKIMNTTELQQPPNAPYSTWKQRHKKQIGIFIACMFAYGTILMILADGGFAPHTVLFGIQLLNTLGFFLALTALLKK